MMMATGETITTAEEFPEDRNFGFNGNPNPNGNRSWRSNPPADPILECGCTARTWSLITIVLKFLGVGILIQQSYAMSSGVSAARTTDRSSQYDSKLEFRIQALEFVGTALFWISFPFLVVYFVGLVGVLMEKLSLIAVYGLCLVFESVAGISFIFYLHLSLGAPIILGLPYLALWIWNTSAIRSVAAFWKRVRIRQSTRTESEPATIAVYSA